MRINKNLLPAVKVDSAARGKIAQLTPAVDMVLLLSGVGIC